MALRNRVAGSGGSCNRGRMWRVIFLLGAAAGLALAEPGVADAVKASREGDLAGAKLILEAVLAKEPGNAAARNLLRTVDQQIAGREKARRIWEAVTIPRIDLRDASAREAFEFVGQQIARQAPGGRGPNLVWMVPAEYPNRVTLSLQNVPGATALDYVAQTAGLQVVFEPHALRVSPAVD